MKQLLAVLGCLVMLAPPSSAQQTPSADELKALVVGKSLAVGNDGVATYKADGSYEYFSQSNGQTSRGKYSISGDRLCADFGGGRSRCDQIIKMPAGLVLKNSQGNTFSVTVK